VQKIVKTLLNHKIILVTNGLSAEEVTKANMQLAKTPDEALRMAYDIVGADAGVVVIPDGVAVLV
jgi:nickel-dependent lactate racemase